MKSLRISCQLFLYHTKISFTVGASLGLTTRFPSLSWEYPSSDNISL